jgi:hypothetical protein
MTTAPVGNNVDDLLAVRASELQAFDWVKLPASYMTERQITNRALAGEYDDRRVSFAAYRDSDPFPEPKMVLTRSGELYRFFSGFSRRTYLGSLSEDHHCLAERIKQGGTPGQQESNNVPVSQLARLYGGDSDFVYGRSNLIELWRTKYYQEYCGPGRK